MKNTGLAKTIVLLIAFTTVVLSCSRDNDTNDARDGKITSLNDPDYNPEDLRGIIEGEITLPRKEYLLTGPLVVSPGSVLTIHAGTTFKAGDGLVGTSIYLAVKPGAKIMAEGTEKNPIIFTSGAEHPNPGDWGGIILAGKAGIDIGETNTSEVADITFGGSEDNDNSGVLKYVITEYTGARINANEEFNAFTFYAVGSGTTVNNIACYYGDDDGAEFFGGNVEVNNLLVVDVKDDMFDWTQGFQGKITNGYGIRQASYKDATNDPRGIEADGNLDGKYPDAERQSNPTLSNITIVNNNTSMNSSKVTSGRLTEYIKIRRHSSCKITNLLCKLGTGAAPPNYIVDFKDGDRNDGNLNATIKGRIDGFSGNLENLYNPKKGHSNVNLNNNNNATGASLNAFEWATDIVPLKE